MSQYTQCRMERKNKDGSKSIHVAFIPSEFAKVGRHIQIKDTDKDVWDDGWVVVDKGSSMSSEAADQQRGAHKAFATVLDRKKKR